MTAFTEMKLHLSRHMYKRGAYKGDAPLEKRYKSHLRVVDRGSFMAVRMHGTDILRAWDSGVFQIDCGGWIDSPTTRVALHTAINKFAKVRMYVGSRKAMGMSHMCVSTGFGTFRYYDRMQFDAEGRMLTDPIEFERRRVDRAETAELIQDLTESGFLDMYPILYATCTPASGRLAAHPKAFCRALSNSDRALSNSDRASMWPDVIESFKFGTRYNYGGHTYEKFEISDSKDCLSRIKAFLKRDMFEVVKSGVFDLTADTE